MQVIPHTMPAITFSFKWDERADQLAKAAVDEQSGAAWQNLTAYAIKMGYFERLNVHASQICCSPSNRNGYGTNGYDTHDHIDKFTLARWSDGYFLGIVTDIDPSERTMVLAWNEKIVSAAKGLLASIIREDLKYMTLAGSHTTQAFRQQYIYVSIHFSRVCKMNYIVALL